MQPASSILNNAFNAEERTRLEDFYRQAAPGGTLVSLLLCERSVAPPVSLLKVAAMPSASVNSLQDTNPLPSQDYQKSSLGLVPYQVLNLSSAWGFSFGSESWLVFVSAKPSVALRPLPSKLSCLVTCIASSSPIIMNFHLCCPVVDILRHTQASALKKETLRQ